MNLGFFGSLACFSAFAIIRDLLYVMGKPQNVVLFYMIEPICILFRIALFAAYVYYGFWLRVPETIKLIWSSKSANTWHKADESFFTNASLLNAFFAWCVYFLLWVFFGYFFLLVIFIVLGVIFGGSAFRIYTWRQISPFFIEWIPMAIRRYVWGLSEWQL